MKPSKVLFLSSRDVRKPVPLEAGFGSTLRSIGNNTGNILFTNAIQTYLESAGAEYDLQYYGPDAKLSGDLSDYQCCIVNCANWLSPQNANFLEKIATDFENARTPTYFIGLGAQAPLGMSADFLGTFSREAKKFVRSILETGGAFGLRGAFTAECFKNLGFDSGFSVTGCPSLYQLGATAPNLPQRVPESGFTPALHGRQMMTNETLITDVALSQGYFLCQDSFIKILVFPDEVTSPEMRSLLTHPCGLLELLIDHRLVVFFDFPSWVEFFQTKGITVAFGNRIHGSFAALLAGVPAIVECVDSRTRELCDFFGIPTVDRQRIKSVSALKKAFTEADYTHFKRTYEQRYSEFIWFIKIHNLPLSLNPGETNCVASSFFDSFDTSVLNALVRRWLSFRHCKFLTPILSRRVQFLLLDNIMGRFGTLR